MTRVRYLLPLFGCAVLLACTGCPSPVDIASRGYTELVGAQYQAQVISEISAAELAGHGSIQVDRVDSDLGRLLPAEFPALVEANLRSTLTTWKGPGTAGSPLHLVGHITYWQIAGSIETYRGKERIAVMHVTASADDGRKLGEFLVVASSNALHTTDLELAQALARGVANYIQGKLPK